ncbi:demethylspheroidene O-methyltransferase [Sagittula marina]|uniref:Demethylspheroidene O-methyltransferase n=1 Tax=Sagittula marina TaxID=943940 RepID=A0A7W6DWS4_9RHOB|nr:methyltransferase [Sagittula marina]MBB3988065.1 demethylspheroidene O-methyltransferase [Sagittula marina]
MARRDGANIFDILQGFVAAQVLLALIEMDVLRRLLDGARDAAELAVDHGIDVARMQALLQAGAALDLLRLRRDGRFVLARKGAAILGVPGLEDMVRHHRVFYDDMSDPVALLRGEGETNMARFWPYVFGQGADISPEASARYSDLMARSQVLVAEDTLRAVRLRGVRQLMDVGGGSGVFLSAALHRYRSMTGVVFDLPGVQRAAETALTREGLLGPAGRARFSPGSFRATALPTGADAVSLVRVLYDHDDDTVRDLLAKVHAALPAGGRLIISEPMSGGSRPDRATDVYFAFYTMAMGTGRTRSAERIVELCQQAGFANLRPIPSERPYITRVVTANRA